MLTQIQEGKTHLEDPDAYIELIFDQNCERGSGIFTRNCFVLVQGYYTEDASFRVTLMGMPLPEHRDLSLKALNTGVDFFGGIQFKDDAVCFP